MKQALTLSLLFFLIVSNAQEESDFEPFEDSFDKTVLVVTASEHACHRFDIYLAVSNEQRNRGLMFVRDMPEMTGMLFIYERDLFIGMYMKNTFIPLDMLFVRADGTVSSIAYDTEPQSLESIRALEPVRYVLELNAGIAEKYSIDKYSRLDWDGMPAVE